MGPLMESLKTAAAILQNIRILAHIFSSDPQSSVIVGVRPVDNSREQAIVFDWQDNTHRESKIFDCESTEVIVNVISQNFSMANGNEILITTKLKNQDETYRTYLISLDNNFIRTRSSVMLFVSSSIPIVISKQDEDMSIVIYSVGKDLIIAELQIHDKPTIIKTISNISLKGFHYSAFLSLNMDFNTYLALHTVDNDNNKYMRFYEISTKHEITSIAKDQKIQLPKEMGPLLFSEISDSNNPDMIFISKEDGKYYINLYMNISNETNNARDYMYQKLKFVKNDIKFSKPIKFDLAELGITNPVLGSMINDVWVPGGIFIANTRSSTNKEIYIIDGNNVKVLIFDKITSKFVIDENITQSLHGIRNAISISLCDLTTSGVYQYLINTIDESGSMDTQIIPFEVEKSNSSITLLTTATKYKHLGRSFIPGAIYFIGYNSKSSFVKTSQDLQFGFPSLQMHRKIIGLGETSLIINNIRVIIPNRNARQRCFDLSSTIFPNTYSMFNTLNGAWSVKCYFSGLYYYKAIVGVLVLFTVFLTIYIILSYCESKKNNFRSISISKSVFETL